MDRLLPRGRIGRGLWWLGMAVVAGLSWLAGRGLHALFQDALFTSSGGRVALMASMLAMIWAAGALAALRFQDRDLDPAPRVLPVMALNLVKALLDTFEVTGVPPANGPLDTAFNAVFVLVGLWLVVACGVRRGTAGRNRFGEDPRELREQGRFPDAGPRD